MSDEQGKLTESYSFKVNYKLKMLKDEFLGSEDIVELNKQYRRLLAEQIHMKKAMSSFQLKDYLGASDDDK
ncbi:hypothetical protein H8E50_00080 [bacterium]|nr:hypothetical protein [bacterium]